MGCILGIVKIGGYKIELKEINNEEAGGIKSVTLHVKGHMLMVT